MIKELSMPKPEESDLRESSELAKLIESDPERAGRSLSPKDRDSYREAQASVVEARRHAETHDGALRIR